MRFSRNYHSSIRKRIKDIESEISNIEENIDLTRKILLENELNTICNNKYKVAQIRSKARWVEIGEKNTGNFPSLEGKHQTSNVIREVVCDDGKRVTRSL